MKYVIWDIETLVNCQTFCFLDVESKARKEFVFYNKDEEFTRFTSFLSSLKAHNYVLVGFNSLRFDAQVIEFILKNQSWMSKVPIKDVINAIYNEAQRIISVPREAEFTHLIPEWRLTHQHIDLFKQKHYDGAAKRGTSLKWLQFTMRFPNIEEMPIAHNKYVGEGDIPTILGYNWNDVDSTAKFFELILFETDLRKTLSERYRLNLVNSSEPRLAKEIFAKFLSEDMNLDKRVLKTLRTVRDIITVKDIIFPYIRFSTPQLNAVRKVFEAWVVNPNVKKKKGQFEHSFMFNGADTVVGLGGIHGCIKPGVYEATDDHLIHDIDVVSFYPNLAIQNGLRPEHLGETFNRRYDAIFQERKTIPKADPINYVFKIILNSTYGLSKEENSYLYDPLFTFSITINGQLTILMLAEQLLTHIPNVKFYQLNTDGISIGYDKQYAGMVSNILKEFSEETRLEVEEVYYKKMIIRDVNNYIAVYNDESKEPKKKGLFETNFNWKGKQAIDYHKNPSFNVIALALEAYYVKGIDYREFILNHKDIYDFCGAIKKKHDFSLNLYQVKNGRVQVSSQQKVTRYFIANSGGVLMKDYLDGRQISCHSQTPVVILNKLEDEDYFANINYVWYCNETKKIIDTLKVSTELTLF